MLFAFKKIHKDQIFVENHISLLAKLLDIAQDRDNTLK